MLLAITIIFTTLYITNIIKKAIWILQIKKGLNLLHTYISCYKNLSAENTYSKEHLDAFNALMAYNPVISRFSPSNLSYTHSQFENREAAEYLLFSFRDKLDQQKHTFYSSFNPLCAFKTLLRLPSTLLSWMGFRISEKKCSWFDAFGWIVTGIFDMFGEEIKTSILSLF